jgi:excisionase family DNA binding protein
LAKLSPPTIRLYIRKRRLKALQVGSRVLVARADLEKFLEAHPIEALPD